MMEQMRKYLQFLLLSEITHYVQGKVKKNIKKIEFSIKGCVQGCQARRRHK